MRYFWVNKQGEMGLTSEALKELGVLWIYNPRVVEGDDVAIGQDIATVQTTTKLEPLLCPIRGKIQMINTDVYPHCIKADTVLFRLEKRDALPSM